MDEASPSGLQAFRFSTASYRPHERVAAWREVFGRTLLHIDIDPVSREGFEANALVACGPNFGLLHASTSAAFQANSRALITSDDVSFGVATSGRWGASQLGRSAELQSGDGVFLSNGDVGSISLAEDCHFTTFGLPKAVMAQLVPDLGAAFARRVPASNPALRLLVRYLELARGSQVLTTPALVEAYTTHVADLLALALGATADGAEHARTRGLSSARLHAMKEDIRRNLGRAELSVHWIAARHGVSARYVQKLFDESGCTFTRHLMEERLSAAFEAFAAPSDAPINKIVYELGFGDLSNFNRAFRRRFGCTPSDVRDTVRPTRDGAPENSA
jgi:AraC-like DNA-binding protein